MRKLLLSGVLERAWSTPGLCSQQHLLALGCVSHPRRAVLPAALQQDISTKGCSVRLLKTRLLPHVPHTSVQTSALNFALYKHRRTAFCCAPVLMPPCCAGIRRSVGIFSKLKCCEPAPAGTLLLPTGFGGCAVALDGWVGGR